MWVETEHWENIIFINKVLRTGLRQSHASGVLGCHNRGTEVIILRHRKLKHIIRFSEWLARNNQAGKALIFNVEQHGGGICENMASQ